ncbi:MAG: hypothetical protein A3G34_05125 [Candidatus Lindowbacteria bacterium RIFCSPLOWO2_12_FULL_62_27]|nr:MAG: hypothetical protein A3I06_07440 [Candidatus Lindowbacteria bacterium RIFCSPLOWO2_02_FULL_62_12]OGH61473.1 MAG: hypothetical protein A3G34_05125 [Candidatus Lindowbacteria bacterium RIFCSPLOWO2_12_FULL_62_27]
MPQEFWVKVTPRASKDEVVGWADQVLKARVRAVPEGGRANEALVELLSDYCGLPKSAFTIVRGHTARLKRIRVARRT